MPDERTALITGGSRGIGRACALVLAESGWEVVITYRNGAAEATDVVSAIRSIGKQATAYAIDVSVEKDVRQLFQTIRSDHSPLRVVVSNAGITRDGFALMMSLSNWQTVIDTNLTSAFLVARESLKTMRRIGGSLIFMSSVSGLRGQPGQANYAASKGGLNAMTQVLAREAAKDAIRVNAVAPGFTDTAMVRHMPKQLREELVNAVPLGRIASPQEIASVVRFLASEEASYVTGQVISVDGGLTS